MSPVLNQSSSTKASLLASSFFRYPGVITGPSKSRSGTKTATNQLLTSNLLGMASNLRAMASKTVLDVLACQHLSALAFSPLTCAPLIWKRPTSSSARVSPSSLAMRISMPGTGGPKFTKAERPKRLAAATCSNHKQIVAMASNLVAMASTLVAMSLRNGGAACFAFFQPGLELIVVGHACTRLAQHLESKHQSKLSRTGFSHALPETPASAMPKEGCKELLETPYISVSSRNASHTGTVTCLGASLSSASSRLEAIASRLEAITLRLEAIASRFLLLLTFTIFD